MEYIVNGSFNHNGFKGRKSKHNEMLDFCRVEFDHGKGEMHQLSRIAMFSYHLEESGAIRHTQLICEV